MNFLKISCLIEMIGSYLPLSEACFLDPTLVTNHRFTKLLAQRTWATIERAWPAQIVNAIHEMMSQHNDIAITGSTVLYGIEPWHDNQYPNDIDIVVPLSDDKHQMICDFLVKTTRFVSGVSIQNSMGKTQDMLCGIIMSCKQSTPVYNSRYFKHNKGVCITIYFHMGCKMDILMVPDSDVYRWIQEHFDLDICANALFEKQLKITNPNAIAHHQATFNQHQYCCNVSGNDNEFTLKTRHLADKFDCRCVSILDGRIRKYKDRGYALKFTS